MNDENLIPVTKRTPREQLEIARKGGQASARKKKERKMWADILKTIGSAKAPEKYKEKLKEFNIDENSYENVMIVNGIAVPAIKGDRWAIEQWGKMTGNLKESVELSGSLNLTQKQQEIEDLLND